MTQANILVVFVCGIFVQYCNAFGFGRPPSMFRFTEEDAVFIEDFVNGLNFTDPMDQQAVLIYLRYCPETDLCRVSTNAVKARFMNRKIHDSCCAPCSCEEDCVERGNCCPDMYQNLTQNLVNYIQQERYDCIPSRYMIFGMRIDKDDSVWGIARCENRTDHLVVQRCEEVSTNSFNYKTHVLVTDTITGTIYQNMYCARCNGVHDNNIQGWDVQLKCRTILQNNHSPPGFADLDRNSCFLDYIPKNHLDNSTRCYTTRFATVLEPNVTQDLERLCRLYKLTYSYEYENVFCMLLDESRRSHTPEDCYFQGMFWVGGGPRYGYSFLIDFHTIRTWEQDEESAVQRFQGPKERRGNCSSDEIHESLQNVCLPVLCGEGRKYSNGSCQSVYVLDPPKVYGLTLRMAPTQGFPTYYLWSEFLPKINVSLVNLLNTSLPSELMACRISIFVPESREKVSSIYVRAFLAIPTIHKDLTNYLMALELGTLSVHSVYYNSSLHLQVSLATNNVLDCPSDTAEYCKLNNHNIGFHRAFTWTSDEVKCDMVVIYPITRMETIEVCPKICTLDFHSQYSDTDELYKSVCLSSTNICFKNGEYTLKVLHICFCIENYFSKLKRFHLRTTGNSSCVLNSYNLPAVHGIVSFTCTLVSCFCLFVVIVAYACVTSLRTLPGKNNLFLSIFLLLAQVLFQIGIDFTDTTTVCKILGLLIHMFWLCVFFWTNVCTFHMARSFAFNLISFYLQSDDNKTFIRYNIYCLSMCFLFLLVNIVTSLVQSGYRDMGYGGCVCYISSSVMVLLTMFVPAIIVVFANLLMFLCVIIQMRKMSKFSQSMQEKRKSLTIYCKMSSITGASWVILFINEFIRSEILGLISSILSSLAGVYIFLAFILNKRTFFLFKAQYFPPLKSSSESNVRSTKM